jgi:hypothetical protein
LQGESKSYGVDIPEGSGFNARKEVERNKLEQTDCMVNNQECNDSSVDSSDGVIHQKRTINTTGMEDEPVLDKWKTRRVECPKCEKLILKAHVKRHMKANHKYKRTFSCNLYGCGRGFDSKKKLENHVMYYHEENIPVPEDKICPYCKVRRTACSEHECYS